MNNEPTPQKTLLLSFRLWRWLLLAVGISFLAGSASALFLHLLDVVTALRESHLWLIACLPLAGLGIGSLYERHGKSVEAGNHLILDEIHEPREVVPLRMAPLVLLGTLVTHLFGGSAGREGTAIQMGASLADQLSRPFRLTLEERRIILMAGMSAGFGSVFGTPFAGAVFALEVLEHGKRRAGSALLCLFCSLLANQVALLWGTRHTLYAVGTVPGLDLTGVATALAAGVIFGLTSRFFTGLTHRLGPIFASKIRLAPLRPVLGGALVALSVWALGSTRQIGLGIPAIVESFSGQSLPWDFALKISLTALTLGSGFKGGEVTPLFFIGATLGNTLGFHGFPLPPPLLAAMGFTAVFGAAAHTPIAATLLGIELFGSACGLPVGLACLTAWLVSGSRGFYRSRRASSSR